MPPSDPDGVPRDRAPHRLHLGDAAPVAAVLALVEYLAERLRGWRGRLGMTGLLAVSPPPSWVVNASAGLLAAPIFIVFAANLAGRTVTYGLGVGLTGLAAGDLTDRLHEALGPVPVAISLGVLALTVWLFLSIEWQTLLENRRLRLRGPLGPLRRPG